MHAGSVSGGGALCTATLPSNASGYSPVTAISSIRYTSWLGRSAQRIAADLSTDSNPRVFPTYLTATHDWSASIRPGLVTTTLVFHLSPCSCCNQPTATRLRITHRNGIVLDQNSSTETALERTICNDCHKREQTRRRVAAHRDSNRQPKQPITCRHCGTGFIPQRKTAQFCSDSCRVAAHRQQRQRPSPTQR